MAGTWGQLGDEFAGENGVQIAQIDCTKARPVCDKSGVGGFPTLKVFFNGAVESTFRGTSSLFLALLLMGGEGGLLWCVIL